jgi:hypothetical protein
LAEAGDTAGRASWHVAPVLSEAQLPIRGVYNQERIDAIYAGVPATNDAAVLEAGTLTARGLVALLRTLRDHIAELDRRIKQLVMAHPDGALFALLPGAGAVLVAAFDRGLGDTSRALPTGAG